MNIIEDKQNKLFKRREVKAIVEAEKNPSMQEASKLIADEFKLAEENIAIKLIKGKFGRNTFLIVANIYNSKEDKEKTEPKQKGKKGGAEKPAEPAAAPAEAPTEKPAEGPETKPEENKEEVKE